jgi:uncharacterized protein (UPF0261 family)
MTKSVAIVGTLDTKGKEIKYIREGIEARGHNVVVIDVGVLGTPLFEPAIRREQVAQAAGSSIEELIGLHSESKAIARMAKGASKLVAGLVSNGGLDGVLALGGTMGTSLALEVMGGLPIGVPKLILSTVAFSPAIPADMIKGDVMMLQWVAGLQGINSINRKVLDVALGAISGAAEVYDGKPISKTKTRIGMTAMGSAPCRYVNWLRPALEEKGYEVAVFHATGMGGRMFEQAIADGLIDIALDLELTELANELCGGLLSAGKHRLEAAGAKGIPQIVAPTVNVFMLATSRPIPRKCKDRPTRRHNSLVTNYITSWKEKAVLGELIARKLNKAKGPVTVLIPTRGRYPLDQKMEGTWVDDAREMAAVSGPLKSHLKPTVNVVEVDAAMNEQAYSDTLLEIVDEMVETYLKKPQ